MSLDTLAALADHPERGAVLTDFDGSLAPIVDEPATAVPLPGVKEVLARLVARLGLVAVVSGRPAAFLAEALPAPGLVLAGLYGLERFAHGVLTVDPGARAHAAAVAAAAAEAEVRLPGLFVERKGDLAVTFHWRRTPHLGDEGVALGRELAARHGLAAVSGRMAIELRPPVPVDKGTVVEELGGPFAAVVFAGDDTGDLVAFDALDRLDARPDGRTARIAVRSPESPPGLAERADGIVDGPPGLVALLAMLADACGS